MRTSTKRACIVGRTVLKNRDTGTAMSSFQESRPKLVGVSGPLKDKSLSFSAAEVTIGREPANQLWAPDPALSRQHCVVRCEQGHFVIRDLASRNGTLVNGVRTDEGELRHGDRVSIGESVLVFLAREEAFPAEASTVELTETTELDVAPMLLLPEDALYLQPDRIRASLQENDRVARDLNILLKIANGIGSIRDREALAWQLLGMIFDGVPADRGAILYFSDGMDSFESAIAWDRVLGPGNPVRVSRSIVRRVLSERAGLLVHDVQSDESVSTVETLSALRIRSLLCVPLLISGKTIGAIYMDSRDRKQLFDHGHLQFMIGIANLASLALENVRRWEELREENQRLRSEINLDHDMIGTSARIQEILGVIQRVAPTTSTVLIEGDSGTGKELVARAIHCNSLRSDQPFVAINCAALTESLLESELFGHEKGAFTGAVAQKKGKIEVAEGGTLFLDEISELALALQAKLLRVLQEREFERVGGTRPVKVDVRVIAATNKSLLDAVEAGSFRGDLFYRLNVVTITTPPLRERREDIPALAESFLRKFSKKCNLHKKRLSPEAQSLLMQYDWPGNVRELENAIERAVVLGATEDVLPEDLPDSLLEVSSPAASLGANYHGAVKENKKQLVMHALEQANGYYVDAAKILGLHPNSLLRLIRNLGLKAGAKPVGVPPAAD
jgi:transcriptional regulator with GAF, ATPase, and Fis domain